MSYYHGYVGDDYTPEDEVVHKPIVRIKRMTVLKDVYERIVGKVDEEGLVRKGSILTFSRKNEENPEYTAYNELVALGLISEFERAWDTKRLVKVIKLAGLDFEATLASNQQRIEREAEIQAERAKAYQEREGKVTIFKIEEGKFRIHSNEKGKQVSRSLGGTGKVKCEVVRKTEDELTREGLDWEDVFDDEDGYKKVFWISQETVESLIVQYGGEIK